MTAFFSSMSRWWRWRMRQRRVHIRGIAEFRMVGIVVGRERGRWVVDGEDGRPVYVAENHPSAAGIRIGDRVKMEPQSPSTIASPMSKELWTVVQKLDGGDD